MLDCNCKYCKDIKVAKNRLQEKIDEMSNSPLNKFNNDLRKVSGCIKSDDPLVCFLYLLMRDYITAGDVSNIFIKSTSNKTEHIYTNGYLANFAKYIAERLK